MVSRTHVFVMLTTPLAILSAGCVRNQSSDNKIPASLASADDQGPLLLLARRLEGSVSNIPPRASTVRGSAGVVRVVIDRTDSPSPEMYYQAARILRFSPVLSDRILAHDCAILAVAGGEKRALGVAAETEDSILVSLGQKQRFGTQFTSGAKGLHEVRPMVRDISDRFRISMGGRSAKDALVRAKELDAVSAERKASSSPGIEPAVNS